MAGQYTRSKSPCDFYLTIAFIALVLLLSFLLYSADAKNHECDLDTSPFLPAPFNVSSSSLRCRHVWSNFIFRYSLSKDNVLRVIVSTVYTGGWVGMGFSKNGEMVVSSAMVGWIDYDGKAHIKQYFLRGFSPAQVIADQGRLQIIGPPVVVLKRGNMYLAFDLNFSTIPNRQPLTSQPFLFAFSRFKPSSMYMLQKHDKKSTVIFDFSAVYKPVFGINWVYSSANRTFTLIEKGSLRRNHEALSVFGWGFLTPLGVLFARYCRQWDPVWYYLHVVVQFLGFLVGLAGFLAGISLYNKAHSNLSGHRGLGIFIFVLCILQRYDQRHLCISVPLVLYHITYASFSLRSLNNLGKLTQTKLTGVAPLDVVFSKGMILYNR
ncbi:hypothetical protein ACLOJK_010243 [Asimina triloba]